MTTTYLDDFDIRDAWLDPDGKMHDVCELGHARFSYIAYSDGMVDGTAWLEADGGAVEKLKALGWVRISGGVWDLPSHVTDRQRRMIKAWCEWNGQPDPFRRMPVTGFAFI